MPGQSLTPEQILTMLAAAPSRIAAATADVLPAQLQIPPNPGTWSANDVLAHLRSCADMWGNAIMAMLAQDHPTLRAINPRTWIQETGYLEEKFKPSLRAFTKQRSALLTVLKPLPEKDWSRAATVMGAGKPLERTVLFYAQWLAEHERPHLKQIERIVTTLRR